MKWRKGVGWKRPEQKMKESRPDRETGQQGGNRLKEWTAWVDVDE